jgi:hypothetical protein
MAKEWISKEYQQDEERWVEDNPEADHAYNRQTELREMWSGGEETWGQTSRNKEQTQTAGDTYRKVGLQMCKWLQEQ